MKNRAWILIVILAAITSITSCSDEGEEEVSNLFPPLVYAASGIDSSEFRITWSQPSGVITFEVDLASDEDFTNLVAPYQGYSVSETEIKFENLEERQTYYVRVRSTNDGIVSDNSNIVSATTLGEPFVLNPNATLQGSADFNVGNIVQANRLTGQYFDILTTEFNQITAEYEMKMNIMYPSEGNYDFSKADDIVDFATDNNIEVHGHSLVWHNATPTWVEEFSGTDQEFETMVEEYIKETVERYKGKVKSWDVVNEAFEDPGDSPLRNSVFRQKMGDDFVAKCFQWAREADPDLLIFYNDYNMVVDPSKLQSVLDMVDDFQERGIPIDGVGFQMHISYDWPPKSDIAAAAKEITDRGLLLHFSELDVRSNPEGSLTSLTSEREEAHAAKVKEVVEVYNALPEENKFALTIWGVKDDDSWLMDFWGNIDWPLLWDSNFEPKEAYKSFLEGLE